MFKVKPTGFCQGQGQTNEFFQGQTKFFQGQTKFFQGQGQTTVFFKVKPPFFKVKPTVFLKVKINDVMVGVDVIEILLYRNGCTSDEYSVGSTPCSCIIVFCFVL